MRSISTNVFVLIGIFTSQALCKNAALVRIPDCAENGHGTAKGIGEIESSSCQRGIGEMYRRGVDYYTAPSAGCDRLVAMGDCDIFVCNGRNGGTGTVSAGVIATAAQDIHTYCRLDGKTGGRVVVSDPDNNDANSVIIQLGELTKDELKARDVNDGHFITPNELRSDIHARRLFSRSNEEVGLDVAQGINEGDDDIEMEFPELQDLSANMYNEFIRVRDQEPEPNFRNSAQIVRQYEDDQGPFTVFMGYLSRDGLRVDNLGRDDVRIDELLQEAAGSWIGAGLRSIFSMHVFRRWRNTDNNQETHEELGTIVINVERGAGTPDLFLPTGSQPMTGINVPTK